MDSIDSALDEIMNSFLHEFLSVYGRFGTRVGLFSLGNTVKVLQVLTASTQADIYLLKVNNRDDRKRCEVYSKLTIMTPERRQ